MGGRCGAEGRFFKEKAPQKPFLKKVFYAQWEGCEHRPTMPEGARPVFAGGKDRLRWAFLFFGPFFFGRKESRVNKISVVS